MLDASGARFYTFAPLRSLARAVFACAAVPFTLKITDLEPATRTHSAELGLQWCEERLTGLYTAACDHLAATADVTRVADVVEVKGRVRGKVGFDCSRCAEPATQAFDTAFTHHFVGPGKLAAGAAAGDVDDADADADPDVSEHDGIHIELEELCIEHAILALPDVPLCDEDCRGLCPACGANRNHETCACRPEAIAPPPPAVASPWERLKDIRVEPKA